MRRHPSKQHRSQIQFPSYFTHFTIVSLVLLALLIANAPFVAATLPGYTNNQKKDTDFLQADFNDIKPEKNLAQGVFLVADRQIADPIFRETVVLLIHYGPDGAMGLVINRPLKVKLSAIFPDIKEMNRRTETLYLGGPVETAIVRLLVRSTNPIKSSMPVFDDVYLSSSQEVLQRLLINPDKEERFRIYAGYTGWAPHQLESEYDRGHWHAVKADAETLFDKKSSDIWQELIHRTSVRWVRTVE